MKKILKTKQQYQCLKCGKLINFNTSLYKSGLCRSCSHKGKKLTEKHIENLIESHIIHGRYCKSYQNYCIDCGEKIYPNSKRCQSCANLKRFQNPKELKKISGVNNGNYTNGLSSLPYPKAFTKKLKEYIRKRDNYTCQCCGMTQEEHFNKWKKDIEIHHIDYCPDNCDKNNLITLCKQCNNKATINRDYCYAFYTYILIN